MLVASTTRFMVMVSPIAVSTKYDRGCSAWTTTLPDRGSSTLGCCLHLHRLKFQVKSSHCDACRIVFSASF